MSQPRIRYNSVTGRYEVPPLPHHPFDLMDALNAVSWLNKQLDQYNLKILRMKANKAYSET